MAYFRYIVLALLVLLIPTGCTVIDFERFETLPTQELDSASEDKKLKDCLLLEWGENNFPRFLKQELSDEELEKFNRFFQLVVKIIGYKSLSDVKIIVAHGELLKKAKKLRCNGWYSLEENTVYLRPENKKSFRTFLHELGHVFDENVLYYQSDVLPLACNRYMNKIYSKELFDPIGWHKHGELIADRIVSKYYRKKTIYLNAYQYKSLTYHPYISGRILSMYVSDHSFLNEGLEARLGENSRFILTASDHSTLFSSLQLCFADDESGREAALYNLIDFENIILTSFYVAEGNLDDDELDKMLKRWAPSQVRKAINLALKKYTLLEHFKRFYKMRKAFFESFPNYLERFPEHF